MVFPGKYTLIPYYKGENTLFDVSPASVEVSVGHDSVKIAKPFQVHIPSQDLRFDWYERPGTSHGIQQACVLVIDFVWVEVFVDVMHQHHT